MLKQLVLENWRSHARTEFEFEKGTNVLIGSMGSGKSSTMDAISFALFGSFPALQAKKVKLDDTIMNKPEQKNKARVALTFKINGQDYTVKREVPRCKTATGELWRGDTLIEAPQTQRVTERVCELLKIDYDLFTRAVYAEQNNIDYFLEIPKAQRKQKIDELLKISKLENARKNLSTVSTRLKDICLEKQKTAQKAQDASQAPQLAAEVNEQKIKL